MSKEFVAATFVHGWTHEVLQKDGSSAQIPERNVHIALTLIGRVVDDGDKSPRRRVPGEADKAVPRPVALPRRREVEQLPIARLRLRLPNTAQEANIEISQRCIDRLLLPTAKMVRYPRSSALKLTFVEEPQTRAQIRQNRSSSVLFGCEGCGGSRLIVIFKETRRLLLEQKVGSEMVADGLNMPITEAVVEPLVVGVVEPLLLQGPLEIPVHFSQK